MKQDYKECYLVYNEDGYLICLKNHKLGEECLLRENDEELKKDYLSSNMIKGKQPYSV